MTLPSATILSALLAATWAWSPPESAAADPAIAAEPPGSAEKLFRQGVLDYDARNYTAAIESFESAYKISHAPEILFDIGQAHRALGDCQQALEHFTAFVATTGPEDPLLPRARARQQEMQSCAARTSPVKPLAAAEPIEPARTRITAAALAPAIAAPALLQPPPATPSEGERRLPRATCYAAAGSALAMAGTGGVLAVKAHSLQTIVDNSPTWDDATRRADERGRAYGSVSLALFVAAGASTAVAATACWLGWR